MAWGKSPGGAFQQFLFLLFSALCCINPLNAQEKTIPPADSPYLIPQTVFVGDRARLVIPLGKNFLEKTAPPSVTVQDPPELPSTADLIIHRIVRERQGDQLRLLIDFTAFAPGSLPLPPLKIPSLEPPRFLSPGVVIPIASILEGKSPALGDPAPPLEVPGTSLLLYGTIIMLCLFLLTGMGARRWGSATLRRWGAGFHRRRLIRLMRKRLRGLKKDAVSQDAPEKKEDTLNRLSKELRIFLGALTGMPCQAMSPGEFIDLPPLIDPGDPDNRLGEPSPDDETLGSGKFLCGIFYRCDALRFSGAEIPQDALLTLLDGAQEFMETLHRLEKKKAPLGKTRPKGIPRQIPGDAA